MLVAQARRDPAHEIARAQNLVQVNRNVGLHKGKVFSRYSSADVAQQVAILGLEPALIDFGVRAQPLGSHHCTQHVIEAGASVLEELQQTLGRVTRALLATLVHPGLQLFLPLVGRAVGQSQHIVALEMRAFLSELLPTLIVDDTCRD